TPTPTLFPYTTLFRSVSNHFSQPVGKPEEMPPLPPGTVHPASLAASLGELRVNPMELDGEVIRLFVPEYEKVDQAKDKRLHSLRSEEHTSELQSLRHL